MKERHVIRLLSIIVSMLVLAGCGSSQANATPPQDTVPVVQAAVDRYMMTHQSLPVKRTSEQTGLYERYPIDFRLLMSTLQLSEVPSNAYENGGPYYYVLLQVNDAWQVKLIDMSLWQTVTDIQAKVKDYVERNGRIPAGTAAAESLYHLDAKALGLNDNMVRSVYSPQTLPLLVTEEGTVVIDYAFEMMRMIQSLGDQFQPTDDLRDVLTDNSFMLPVHSLPYAWENEQPVIRLP